MLFRLCVGLSVSFYLLLIMMICALILMTTRSVQSNVWIDCVHVNPPLDPAQGANISGSRMKQLGWNEQGRSMFHGETHYLFVILDMLILDIK